MGGWCCGVCVVIMGVDYIWVDFVGNFVDDVGVVGVVVYDFGVVGDFWLFGVCVGCLSWVGGGVDGCG